jgi:hypothetical protein
LHNSFSVSILSLNFDSSCFFYFILPPLSQVPTYKNDFPDWDKEDWAVFVAPSLPTFLVVAVVVCAGAMLAAVLYGVYKRNRRGYVPIADERSTSASWL